MKMGDLNRSPIFVIPRRDEVPTWESPEKTDATSAPSLRGLARRKPCLGEF
jgi:hypothetical protein